MEHPGTSDSKTGLNGLIVESIPRKLHRLINLWIVSRMIFNIGLKMYRKYQEKMQYTVTINGNDELYNDAQVWLLNEIPSKKQKGIRIVSKSKYGDDSMTAPHDNYEPVQSTITTWYDGSIEHAVVINGHKIKVRNEKKDANYVGGRIEEYNSFLTQRDKLLFIAQSTAGRDAVLNLLDQLNTERKLRGRTASLYVSTRWGGMRKMKGLKGRELETVVMPSDIIEKLTADIQMFLRSESEYVKLGIPWHRGYLFYGPPGGGKTSLATALAHKFNRDIYCISLSSLDDDTALNNAIGEISTGSILLLEDIDVIKAVRDRDDNAGVTMQGVLNVLDGLLTPNGLITIMTTNRREVLDDAIVRAGRIDLEFEIGYLSGDDLKRLFEMLVDHTFEFNVPDYLAALPAEIVGVAKNSIGNPTLTALLFKEWLMNQERCRYV